MGFPCELVDPALVGGKLGHVLVQLSSTAARGRFNGILDNQTIGELDWDGNVVWQWGAQAAGGAARQDHDWQRLPNGNTLIIATVERVVKVLSDSVVPDQLVREIAPNGSVVWEWSAGDHLGAWGARSWRQRSPRPACRVATSSCSWASVA